MSQDDRIRTYADLMEDIKLRIDTIDDVTKRSLRIRYKITEELCYLQLRMICELIALGCLVIHGDIKATHTGKLQKAYSADLIIRAMERLHPKFYPASQMPKDLPGDPPEARDRRSGYLSKEKLIKLYNIPGSELHRGSMRNLVFSKKPIQNFDHILDWRNKIVTLLNRPRIILTDGRTEFWLGMRHRENGKVYWNKMILVAEEESTPQWSGVGPQGTKGREQS